MKEFYLQLLSIIDCTEIFMACHFALDNYSHYKPYNRYVGITYYGEILFVSYLYAVCVVVLCKQVFRILFKIKFAHAEYPLASRKTILEQAGIDRSCRKICCNIPNVIAKKTKPATRPPLSKQNKAKRMRSTTDSMKCYFLKVIFKEKYSATQNGQDEFSEG